ncbi:hypothetical protein CC1G_06867 [Coprinopsis cinerea okayama7|uniref:Hemerythrin-like domain-containing protein n=1 Tax=Coprinopsis cinerea (strain Okayama-7 / 130 / ATCC MYA-4618 / FGSC 9003) TaxID=240176 RepID=A8N6Z5_COPC7|nr:hypothetical protein CC1G_06867 [Coprinopsis cinerea okayama7\|eukprot:XP_001830601.2 hypothetical protein CC1G_06867 [Coprinopsis cinerea okayama7\
MLRIGFRPRLLAYHLIAPKTRSAVMSTRIPTSSPEEMLRQEKRLNHLSDRMNQFHQYFKREFNTLHELADIHARVGMPLSVFLEMGKSFIHHLTLHHTLEERHFFPLLAKRMPQFSPDHDSEHLKSHSHIHDGLDKLEALLKKWTESPSEYSPTELRECLDGFKEVLFRHLDQEVADLRGENLLKYFSVREIETFPM